MKAMCAVMVVGLMLSGAGCITMMDDENLARQRADFDAMRTDLDALKERLNVIQAEQQALAKDIETLRRLPREDAAARARLDQIEQQIRGLSAARETDRREIVDEISRKVAGLVNASGSSGRSGKSSGGTETGYEHVVKAGETVSAIAQAYKVSVSAVLKANNLSSGDKLRSGQKLFIPAK